MHRVTIIASHHECDLSIIVDVEAIEQVFHVPFDNEVHLIIVLPRPLDLPLRDFVFKAKSRLDAELCPIDASEERQVAIYGVALHRHTIFASKHLRPHALRVHVVHFNREIATGNNLFHRLSNALLLCSPVGAQDAQKINKKNLVIKEWNTAVRTNRKVLDQVTTYNSDGKKIDEVEYGSSGQKWRKRYEYGADGKVSKEMLYDENNRLVNYKKIEYNEFGRKKVQYTYNPKGKLVSVKVYEYVIEDE